MLRFLFAFLILAVNVFAAVDLSKPIPLVTLTDGRALKNVTLANFTRESVLLRQASGPSVLVRYEFLPEAVREAAESRRPGGPSARPATGESQKPIELRGQVFVETRGAGAYKFANVRVYAFALDYFATWGNTNVNPVKLPKPLASSTTDGDGRFSLRVPAGTPYFIFAQASRQVGGGERFEWHLAESDIKRNDEVMLNSTGRVQWRPVEIEDGP